MSDKTDGKRTYGLGSVFVHRGAWYGRWWANGVRVKRKLGQIREPGSREGLTRKQAEMALRRLMSEVRVVVPEERMTFQEAGDRYVYHVEHVRNRKATTVQDYRIILNKHFAPHFGNKPIDRIEPRDIASYIPAKNKAGLSTKTIVNHLNFAHGVFAFALKHGWCRSNPVAATDRPQSSQADPDIRFLDLEELAALLRAASARDDVLGPTEQALYLTAAMTGLRQGELAGLRWRDVDWQASVIRVRRNYTRQGWGTPKSRRSSRAVPMADRLAGELDRHYKRSAFKGDDDPVFCHPQTGNPYDASKMRKRFYEAMQAAGLGHRCGHDGGITFHSLRHTFGTRMAAGGAPMRALQEWMGHRNLTTTEIYADYAPDPAYGAKFAEQAFTPAPVEETEDGEQGAATSDESDPDGVA